MNLRHHPATRVAPALLAALTLAASPVVAEDVTYTIVSLGTLPGGTRSHAQAINARGQVVGVADTRDRVEHAFLWQSGVMRDLGTLGGRQSYAYAVNDAGQVVGWAQAEGGDEHAFLWQNGDMRDLGTLGGRGSRAYAVNNRGHVVGVSQTGKGSVHAFLWTAEEGMRDLGALPGGSRSEARGINAKGQVVGMSVTADGARRAFLWQDGTFRDLGTLGGRNSQAYGINDTGQVLGWSETGSEGAHAFLYSEGQMRDLGAFPDKEYAFSYGASGIGKAGDIAVGYCRTKDPKPERPSRAFVWQNGKMTDLIDVVRGASGWKLHYASGINGAGQIAGWGAVHNQPRAFLLTPAKREAAAK